MVKVFEDFTYHRTYQRDGMRRHPGIQCQGQRQGELKGIDQIRFDEEGKIVDFEGHGAPHERPAGPGRRNGQAPGTLHCHDEGAKA